MVEIFEVKFNYRYMRTGSDGIRYLDVRSEKLEIYLTTYTRNIQYPIGGKEGKKYNIIKEFYREAIIEAIDKTEKKLKDSNRQNTKYEFQNLFPDEAQIKNVVKGKIQHYNSERTAEVVLYLLKLPYLIKDIMRHIVVPYLVQTEKATYRKEYKKYITGIHSEQYLNPKYI